MKFTLIFTGAFRNKYIGIALNNNIENMKLINNLVSCQIIPIVKTFSKRAIQRIYIGLVAANITYDGFDFLRGMQYHNAKYTVKMKNIQ